ncbi:MAG: ribonuclease III, partial [Pseudohongiellaceae bacterium]
MTASDNLYHLLDYRFKDQNLLRLALSHCSAGKDNNERLEFLGDSILGFIIAEELYRRFPKGREGELSRLRAELVQRSTLADIARELDLGRYLILGAGELKSGGAARESILADALEALISSLYLDGGLELCRSRVLQVFASRLSVLSLQDSPKDPKTRLQEYLQ